MPHFEVKLYPGYRPEQLRTLTDHIVQAAVQDLKVPENVVSVAFQEIAPEHWPVSYTHLTLPTNLFV